MGKEFSRLRGVIEESFWPVTLLLYSGVIFYLSVRPIGEGTPVIGLPGMDKLAHAGEFMVFALIGYTAISNYTGEKSRGIATFLISITYGSVTELTQLFISYRSASILDWLANLAGITIGLVIVVLYNKRKSEGFL